MISLVAIIPDALRADADVVMERMGWGRGTFILPLAPAGSEAPTHWGCRAAAHDETPAFLAADPGVVAAMRGTDWSPLTAERVRAVQAALILSHEQDRVRAPAAHFEAAAAAANLARWSPPDV